MNSPNTGYKRKRGFSIIELAVVVTVISTIAALGVPRFAQVKNRTEATTIANDLRIFTQAVELYNIMQGSFPRFLSLDSIPEDINEMLPNIWKDGSYNWHYYSSTAYTYIYIYNLQFSAEQGLIFDETVDDGNITKGKVRITYDGGFVYLFENNVGV
ncbi:MAG: type II secretion system protein [Verrucomicrobiota bacterium]